MTGVLILAGLALAWYGWRRLARACDAAREADWGHPWLNRLDGLNRLFCRRFHGLEHSLPELPSSGPVLIVANHVSGLDPLLIIAASSRPVHFIIAREEYDRPVLRRLFDAVGCIPVERRGRPDQAMRTALKALEDGKVVALFPHGQIHTGDGPPPRLKRGVLWLAQRARCPVLPVRIEGVRGAGQVLAAVARPSQVSLRSYPVLHCADRADEECMGIIQSLLGATGAEEPETP